MALAWQSAKPENKIDWLALLAVALSFAVLCSRCGAQQFCEAPPVDGTGSPRACEELSTESRSIIHQPRFTDYTVHNESYKAPHITERHRADWLAFAGAVAFEQAASIYDARETEIGLRHGVAFEGNTFLIGTSHPTFGQLEKRELTFYLPLISAPAVIAKVFHKRTAFYGFLTVPAAYGIAHVSGGDQWRALLNK